MRHGAKLEDNRTITPSVVCQMLHQHVEKLSKRIPESQLFAAAQLFDEMVNAVEFPEFLTLRAYERLT